MKRMPLLLSGLFASALLSAMVPAAPAQMRAPTAPEDHAHPKAASSSELAVAVGGKTVSLSLAELQAMPQKTVHVHNAHSNMEETFSGVLLTDVLAKAGVGEAGVGKALLHSYVKARGTDGYWVLYSGVEVEEASHAGTVIVATTEDGKALGEKGQMMLVSTEDKKPQRWVRNLAAVALVKAE